MMNHEPEMNTNDKLLILLAKQGNESAFRELYETHYEMIYRLAYRYVKSQPDAEDILQETFIKAFKAIQKFDFNISSNFSAWIYQICVRCSYDHHRKSHISKLSALQEYPAADLLILLILMQRLLLHLWGC